MPVGNLRESPCIADTGCAQQGMQKGIRLARWGDGCHAFFIPIRCMSFQHMQGQSHRLQCPALERIPLVVGFSAPQAGQPDWAAIFERGLRELHASGEYLRILKRHSEWR